MDSKGLDIPVSVSNKMEVPNLGCRFSEKAEHLPIKKRRFLFRTPSPPPVNTLSSEVNESVAACLKSPTPEVRPKPDASCPPPASFTVADLGCSGSTKNKPDGEKFVKGSMKASEHENICGISLAPPGLKGSGIVSNGIKSLKPPGTIKLEPNNLESPKISAFEIGLRLSTIPSKDFASSSPDKATVDNSSQITNETDKSAALDDRLNWDLNTVMAWEESPECDHTAASCSNITYPDGKNRFKEANLEVCKQERESESVTENIGDKIITDLRSFAYKINEPKPEERKPGRNDIKKLSSPVTSSVLRAAVPSIVKLEYPTSDNSAKHVNLNDLSCRMAAGTGFSLDYSLPPGFDHGKNTCPSAEIVPFSGNNGISAVETTENQKLNLSLVTAASPENDVHQSGTNLDEDDKAQIKKAITATSQDKELNQTNFGSLVMKSSVLPEVEDQPSAVSSVHDADVVVKTEKSTVNEVCDTGIEKIQDNVLDEYDSQIEDGEMRESSIQTWEGSENEDRENEDDTENKRGSSQECAPESSSRIKSADEISSVVLPEKPDSSEQISGPEPNPSHSEEWKMNVSESENYTNVNKIRDLSSIKLYKRDQFFNRGRFRMQGYSCSSSNGDDSGPRGGVKSFRRGKYIPTIGRGGGAATWNRHSLPSFMENDDVRPGNGPSYVPRRMLANREEDDFRARLGLRPTGENRFRGRGLRYGSRGGVGPGPGPRGRYHGLGPASDDSPPMEYPSRQHHCGGGSTSPPRSRTLIEGFRQRRSRSPRIRRGNEHVPGGYNNLESPRWVKYRRSPPPINERLTFYDSSRKTKPNDNFRSGRFSDIHGGGGPRYDGDVMENGYRRGGGFVRRPVKHIEYEEEDGYGGAEGFGPKPYGYGPDTRFRDNLPRIRAREERDNW